MAPLGLKPPMLQLQTSLLFITMKHLTLISNNVHHAHHSAFSSSWRCHQSRTDLYKARPRSAQKFFDHKIKSRYYSTYWVIVLWLRATSVYWRFWAAVWVYKKKDRYAGKISNQINCTLLWKHHWFAVGCLRLVHIMYLQFPVTNQLAVWIRKLSSTLDVVSSNPTDLSAALSKLIFMYVKGNSNLTIKTCISFVVWDTSVDTEN